MNDNAGRICTVKFVVDNRTHKLKAFFVFYIKFQISLTAPLIMGKFKAQWIDLRHIATTLKKALKSQEI